MFEGYLSHRGRIGRLRLLKLSIVNALAIGVLSIPVYILYRLTESPFVWIFLVFFGLPICYSNLMLSIKRLHDLNLSGWWMLLFFLISIGLDLIDSSRVLRYIFGIAEWVLISLVPGTDGPNRFGPEPGVPGSVPPSSGNVSSFGAPAQP